MALDWSGKDGFSVCVAAAWVAHASRLRKYVAHHISDFKRLEDSKQLHV